MIFRPAALAACLIAFGGGCSTWPQHGVEINPPRKIRIVVLPVRSEVKIRRLGDIYTVPRSTQPLTGENSLIEAQMAEATKRVAFDLETRLRASYFFEVVAASQTRAALEGLGILSSTVPWTREQSQAVGKALNAPLILNVRLSGYGKIKRKWLFYLIGSGFVEGVFQGAIVGTAAGGNPWVAAGVATEEVLQETLTWGGGAWLFGRFFTPVILDCTVISAADGEAVWQKVVFARRDRKRLKLRSKEERARKELRLRLTAEKAVEELVRRLEKKAWKNIQAQP